MVTERTLSLFDVRFIVDASSPSQRLLSALIMTFQLSNDRAMGRKAGAFTGSVSINKLTLCSSPDHDHNWRLRNSCISWHGRPEESSLHLTLCPSFTFCSKTFSSNKPGKIFIQNSTVYMIKGFWHNTTQRTMWAHEHGVRRYAQSVKMSLDVFKKCKIFSLILHLKKVS